MSELTSKLYQGWLRHRRTTPVENCFQYNVFMVYLNLDELDTVFSLTPFWRREKISLAQFRRSDFHQKDNPNLKQAVLDSVECQLGERPKGAVYMLGNLRYFGYTINPLCTYYCFDENGQLHSVLAEVTNTPWGESHAYALKCTKATNKLNIEFSKRMHVSPFNPVDMQYKWVSTCPSETALIHIENWRDEQKVMDATLSMNALAMTPTNMNKILLQYPFMTIKTVAAIYFQALKLWLKKSPFYGNPSSSKSVQSNYTKV